MTAPCKGSSSFFMPLSEHMGSLSTQTPLSKKRKVSGDVVDGLTQDEPGLRKSACFWLDDGNIILRTSKTQFRVHKSVLKMHSTVFEDMFSVPQPVDQPTFDGCPFVVLTDDDDKDWELLLATLYHTNL